MPWRSSDAGKHTKRATTPGKQRTWARIANATLKATGDEGRAVRMANAAMLPTSTRKGGR